MQPVKQKLVAHSLTWYDIVGGLRLLTLTFGVTLDISALQQLRTSHRKPNHFLLLIYTELPECDAVNTVLINKHFQRIVNCVKIWGIEVDDRKGFQ